MTILRKLACVVAMTAGMLVISSSAFAQQATTPLFAVLNGGNECASPPAPAVCRRGDLNGFGAATVIFPNANTVCFGIVVGGLGSRVILAHIHSGTSGINGPIVIPFIPTPIPPPASGNPGASSGCVPGARATISAIRADPTKFYVNVHTIGFPAGAIRGQLQ